MSESPLLLQFDQLFVPCTVHVVFFQFFELHSGNHRLCKLFCSFFVQGCKLAVEALFLINISSNGRQRLIYIDLLLGVRRLVFEVINQDAVVGHISLIFDLAKHRLNVWAFAHYLYII